MKKRRGLATVSPEKRREIASKGGQAKAAKQKQAQTAPPPQPLSTQESN